MKTPLKLCYLSCMEYSFVNYSKNKIFISFVIKFHNDWHLVIGNILMWWYLQQTCVNDDLYFVFLYILLAQCFNENICEIICVQCVFSMCCVVFIFFKPGFQSGLL